MASTSLNAKISTTGAAKAERELKGVSTQAKKAENNVIDLGNGFKGATTQTKKFTVSAKDLISPLKAGAVAVLALSGAITGLVVATASQVTEQRNMAAVSKQTIAGFNAMSFAASQFGVTNEQLSDQFKDVNEKIGEFLTTGGGGLQDYIDTMGLSKKAGMEFAQSLRNMSGQDALQLMINNMQAANKSTREMSFAVEGLASDLTKSLPLFLDNGKALKDLNAEFALFTSPLTDEEVDLYAELNKNVALSQAAFRSLAENALIPVIGYVSDLAEQWTWFMASMNEGTSANITSRMADIQDEIEDLTQEAENATTAFGRFKNVLTFDSTTEEAAKNKIVELRLELEGLRGELNTLQGSEPPALNGNKADPLSPIKPIVNSAAEAQAQAELKTQKTAQELQVLADLEFYDKRMAYKAKALAEEAALNKQAYEDDADFYMTMLDLKQKEDERVTSLKEKEKSDQISALGDVTTNLAATLGEQSALYKAAAITETTINTYKAAQSAYAALAGIPIVGPALGGAAAGVAIAAGVANVRAITSARYQGGSLAAGQSSTIAENKEIEVIAPANASRVRTAAQMKGIMGESGGKTEMNVTIINQGSGTSVTTEQKSDNEMIVLIRDTVSADMATPNTQIDKSMTSRGQPRKR